MGVLDGKVAIITGSGRGIGRGMALLFAQEGAKVVVNDLGGATDGSGGEKSPADEVVAEIKKAGGAAVVNYDSVASMAGGESIIKTALDNFGKLDIVVNNAGILRDRRIFNMNEEDWDAVIAVHLKGHFAMIKPASVIFRQQRSGCFVNFTSTSGIVGNAGQANYGAAKAGVAGLTQVVARDLGRYGVRCNAVAPVAGTRMTATIPGIGDLLPKPEWVAPLACYLASDLAANINGQIFGAAGGTYMVYSQPRLVNTIFKQGRWTLDELVDLVPKTIAQGLVNPSPPKQQ